MRVRPRSLPTICTGDSGEAAGLLEGRASCKAPPAVSAPGVTILTHLTQVLSETPFRSDLLRRSAVVA